MITILAMDDGDDYISVYRNVYRTRIGQVRNVLANTANKVPSTLARVKLARR